MEFFTSQYSKFTNFRELGYISDFDISDRPVNSVNHFLFDGSISGNPFGAAGGHGYLFVNQFNPYGSQVIFTNGGIAARRIQNGYGTWKTIITFS